MGVKGLLSYIRQGDVLQEIQLSLLAERMHAKTGKQPKLLCDFLNFQHCFWSTPIGRLLHCGDYPMYTAMCGPDFHLVFDRASKFVGALRHIGIEPVFFVDARKGSDESFEGKLPVLQERWANDIEHVYLTQQICEHSMPQSAVLLHCHPLVCKQILMAFQAVDAEVVFCKGEADPDIVRYALTHEETCGILSNDSDFAITNLVFPVQEFDIENLIGLNKGVLIDDKPGEILAAGITPAKLARSLDIRENQLVDLAILCGTDFTREHIRRFSVLSELGVEGFEVVDVAMWLKDKEGPLLSNETMKTICLKHPELLVAIQQSYDLYALLDESAAPEVKPPASPVYELVEKEMLESAAFSVAKAGVFWLSLVYEDLTLGQPCFTDTLRCVRKTMYSLLGVREVTEYGRSTFQTLEKKVVAVCSSEEEVKAGVDALLRLRGMDKKGRLAAIYAFNNALSLQTVTDLVGIADDVLKSLYTFPDFEWPKLFKLALLCCSLKMIANLNKGAQPSLDISDSELDYLLLSSLTCATEGEIPPHIVHVMPPMRSISVGEWFCHILSQFYTMACLLGLNESIPEPRHVFYPMAFVPYHLALQSHTKLTARQEADVQSIRTAFQTALAFPAVQAFRSCIFDVDILQPLSDLISLCSAALDEVTEKADQLLPRVMTAPVEELFQEANSEQNEDTADEAEPSIPVLGDSDEVLTTEGPISGNTPEEGTATAMSPEQPRVWGRDDLPVMEHKDRILELIAGYQVVCIEGETGCGKSSQIPQFILDESESCRILVSQPTLIAAEKLAKRVSDNQKTKLGEMSDNKMGEIVSYCGSLTGAQDDAKLIYGTNEYVLKVYVYTMKHADSVLRHSGAINAVPYLYNELSMLSYLKFLFSHADLASKPAGMPLHSYHTG